MKVSIKPIETQCFAKDLAAGEKFTVVRPETIGELFKGTVFYSPDKPSELLMVTDGSSVVGMCNAVIIDGPLVDRTGTSVYLDEDHQVVVVPVE